MTDSQTASARSSADKLKVNRVENIISYLLNSLRGSGQQFDSLILNTLSKIDVDYILDYLKSMHDPELLLLRDEITRVRNLEI